MIETELVGVVDPLVIVVVVVVIVVVVVVGILKVSVVLVVVDVIIGEMGIVVALDCFLFFNISAMSPSHFEVFGILWIVPELNISLYSNLEIVRNSLHKAFGRKTVKYSPKLKKYYQLRQ